MPSMLRRGGRLVEILKMGQWECPDSVTHSYLPESELEAAAVLESQLAASDSDDADTGAHVRRPRLKLRKRGSGHLNPFSLITYGPADAHTFENVMRIFSWE